MKRVRALILSAGVIALIPILAMAQTGPTRVRLDSADSEPPIWSIRFGGAIPVYPTAAVYDPPGYVATPEIINRVGEVLGAIDNSEERSKLAEQWLQFSKQTIAKDQEFRDKWLDLQRQQLAQQQEAAQLRLEIAQLQVRIEELRAQNLRLEQQTFAAQQNRTTH
jgi:CRISPR/Cas system CMR subunit Cmr4 (Cas7 group RAMP superfamily)